MYRTGSFLFFFSALHFLISDVPSGVHMANASTNQKVSHVEYSEANKQVMWRTSAPDPCLADARREASMLVCVK